MSCLAAGQEGREEGAEPEEDLCLSLCPSVTQPGLPSAWGRPWEPDIRGFSLIRTRVRPFKCNEMHEGTQRNLENL